MGGAPAWVCRRLRRLPAPEVALVLIHEALHRAGLGERPEDRSAPTSREINRRVRAACGL